MRFFLIVLAAGFLGSCTASRQSPSTNAADPIVSVNDAAAATDDAASEQRTYFYALDYEGGVLSGREHIDASLPSSERAWYLWNQARNRAAREAMDEAKAWVEQASDNPWSWFALAGTASEAENESETALRASTRALELAPDNVDVHYLRAEVLRTQQSHDAALAFLDSLLTTREPTTDLLVSKAQALYEGAGDYTPTVDEERIKAAFATFAQAQALDPTNVRAHFGPGELLRRKRRMGEAMPLMERAAALSPLSAQVQQEYGHALLSHPDLTEEEKKARIVTIIEQLLAKRGNAPEALYKAADLYADLDDYANQEKLFERILELEPQGPRAEWVHLLRIRQYRDANQDALYPDKDPIVLATYRKMLQDFVNRSWHVRDGLVGEAYMNLFLMVDSTMSDDDLLAAVQGMVQYEELNPHITYRQGPTALAERGVHLREAERIARAGIEPARKQVEERRARFESEEQYQENLNYVVASQHDVIGYIYLQEGRLDKAEAELAHAYDLTDGGSRDILYHLGQLYEARYDQARAASEQATSSDAGDLPNVQNPESLFTKDLENAPPGRAGMNPSVRKAGWSR